MHSKQVRLYLIKGAKIIGVNNRNLHNFHVDMETTTRVAKAVKESGKSVILAALSGITSRQDVANYEAVGVSAVLVGEHLMRSNDKKAFISSLIN